MKEPYHVCEPHWINVRQQEREVEKFLKKQQHLLIGPPVQPLKNADQ
jgi:hypothetical protein